MPFDFPASPSNGQQVTGANGVVWIWDGVKWVASTAGAVLPSAQTNVGRNFIHNAGFTVAQRGAGPWTTPGGYTLDRWTFAIASDTVSFSQVPLGDTQRTAIGDEQAAFCLQNVFTGNAAAGAQNYVAQNIENVRRLAGKTVTLSFWAAAAAGTPKLGVNFSQVFGTGGSPSTGLFINATGQSVTLSTAWTRYSVTTTFPSIAGKTLGINNDHYSGALFFYSSGATNNAISGNIGVQSGTIQLWGVQLEIGSVATPLDYGGSPQQILQQCQRFYQVGFVQIGGPGTAGVTNSYQYMLPVVMRATPTGTPGTPSSNVNAGTPGLFITNMAVTLSCVPPATGGMIYSNSWTASADL